MSSFYNLTGFLKECPPPAHCPTPPLILPVSPLHRHFYMVVTVSGPAFVEPSRGPPGAGGGGGMRGWGSPHKSQPSPASSPPQPLSQPDKGALALTLPVPRTVSSCRREHDRDSFKKHLEFCPSPVHNLPDVETRQKSSRGTQLPFPKRML